MLSSADQLSLGRHLKQISAASNPRISTGTTLQPVATTTPISTSTQFLVDYGSIYGAGSTVHNLTLYRHSSGALVPIAMENGNGIGLPVDHRRIGYSIPIEVAQSDGIWDPPDREIPPTDE